MQTKWREFWSHAVKKSRSVLSALGVAFVIWLFNLAEIDADQRGRYLLVYLMYGLVIYAVVRGFYSAVWAYLRRKNDGSERIMRRTELHIVISLSAMVVGFLSAHWIHSRWFGFEFTLDGIAGSLLVGTFISLMFTYFYAFRNSKLENAELRAANAQAELHVLKNQMQPHFLFNSLNSLSELIDGDRDEAAAMALKLSDLYREILEASRTELSPLAAELSIVRKYLELEKLRFGDRLRFRFEVERKCEDAMLPPLSLQTLVENAVKHGIATRVDGGEVVVRALAQSDGSVRVVVINPPSGEAARSGLGFGLANTRMRLSHLFGDGHRFSIEAAPDRVEAGFFVPFEVARA